MKTAREVALEFVGVVAVCNVKPIASCPACMRWVGNVADLLEADLGSREPGRDQTLEEAASVADEWSRDGATEDSKTTGRSIAARIRGMTSRPQESPSPPREPGKCATWCGDAWPMGQPLRGFAKIRPLDGAGHEYCTEACRDANPGDSDKERTDV